MEATAVMMFQTGRLAEAFRDRYRRLMWTLRAGRKALHSNRRDLVGIGCCVSVVVGVSQIYPPLGWIVAGVLGLALLHLTTPAPAEG